MKYTIANRLRAGAKVIVIQDPDEVLTLQVVESVMTAFSAGKGELKTISGSNPNILDALQDLETKSGFLITLDLLLLFGANPMVCRLIRQVSLSQKDSPSRLVMIEQPGTVIPPGIIGDVEIVRPELPGFPEMMAELTSFREAVGDQSTEDAPAYGALGLPRHEAARLFARSWIEKTTLDPIWIGNEKARRVTDRLQGALQFIPTTTASVGGSKALIRWTDSRGKAFNNPKAREAGLPEPRGVLILGPPGTGKSLTSKFIAYSWGLPLLRLDAGRLFGSLVGQSESQTRMTIDAAEACAPCVLWIDELEKAFGSQGGLDGGTSSRVIGSILTWLQDKIKPVFVVATANDVSKLRPELLRKGRFDEIFYVGLPSEPDRTEIFKVHLAKRNLSIDSIRLATASGGFSGAEIEQVVIDGMFTAFARGDKATETDVLAAIHKTVPLSKTMSTEIKALEDWARGRTVSASDTKFEPATIGRKTLVG